MIRLLIFAVFSCFLMQPSVLLGQKPKGFRGIFHKKSSVVEAQPVKSAERSLAWTEEWRYRLEEGSGPASRYRAVLTHYDSLGRMAKQYYFGPKGDTLSQYRYDYPEVLKMRKFQTFAGREFLELEETYFGEMKRLSTQVMYKSDGSVLHRFLYDYDLDGRLYQTIHFDDKNEKTHSIVRSYHEYQPSYTEFYRDFKNGEDYQMAIQYDESGQPTERLRYKASGELVEKMLFRYDEQGRLLERSLYKGDEILDIKELYDYVSETEMSKSIYMGGSLLEYTLYVYEHQ